MARIRLPHHAIVRSPGLLPMLYTVSEISSALDLAERTLRDWLSVGAPHSRDPRGHIWINGREFADWIANMRAPKKKRKLRDDEAFCMRCNRVVQMTEISTRAYARQIDPDPREMPRLWLYDQSRRATSHLFPQPSNSKGNPTCKVILDWCTEEISCLYRSI